MKSTEFVLMQASVPRKGLPEILYQPSVLKFREYNHYLTVSYQKEEFILLEETGAPKRLRSRRKETSVEFYYKNSSGY